jgi:hypothetical protein
MAPALGDDVGISVVGPDGGDLADRIIAALLTPAANPAGSSPGADAMLGETA